MSFLVGKAASSGLLSSIVKIALIGGALYLGYRYIKPRLENIIPEFPTLPSFPEFTLPTFPEITLPTFPEITLPTFPEITLPEFPALPSFPEITIPTIPNLTDIGKMEIPIPSFDDVMNFLKSDTGKEVVEMAVPELQGPLAGADVGLIMQVINSQNPREGTSSSSDFPPLPPPPCKDHYLIQTQILSQK